MKKIYFAGKFNLLKDKSLPLEKRLVNDFRSILLGDSKKLTYANDNLKLNNYYQYLGPFYCEQASNRDYTSTDCNVVLNCEYNAVSECDIYCVVFDQSFSVGSVVELGWAISLNKKIIILYRKEESQYDIKSEYWFAIADAIKRSKNIEVYSFDNNEDLMIKLERGVICNEV